MKSNMEKGLERVMRIRNEAKVFFLAMALLLTTSNLFSNNGGLALAEPNRFEKLKLEAGALAAFEQVISLWREELYFELYDLGIASSKTRISQEQFAQRMVELSYVPKGTLNPKHLSAKFRFRTMIYVKARIDYRHKFNPEITFPKNHTFLLLEEEGAWRIDLIQLIRAPYA